MRSLLFALVIFSFSAGIAQADAEKDWSAVLALDAGPPRPPASRQEAILLARNQLILQRKALQQFVTRYPEDSRNFEARLRLASILAAEGKMNSDQGVIDEALRQMAELEKTPGLPQEKLADAGFRRVSLAMQSQTGTADHVRDAVVASAKAFASRYPGDRRGPRLLVEAATICDDVPNQKRDLLDEAMRLTREEALRLRISDDLKRLDHLGRPLELKLSSVQGASIDLPALRGNVVVVIFWSAESPHSLLWLRDFRNAWEGLAPDQLKVITISLDEDRKALDERLRALPPNWPTHFDGKGWQSPTVRALGINALPTVWILDKKGVLRTLNARESYTTWIRQLLRE